MKFKTSSENISIYKGKCHYATSILRLWLKNSLEKNIIWSYERIASAEGEEWRLIEQCLTTKLLRFGPVWGWHIYSKKRSKAQNTKSEEGQKIEKGTRKRQNDHWAPHIWYMEKRTALFSEDLISMRILSWYKSFSQ